MSEEKMVTYHGAYEHQEVTLKVETYTEGHHLAVVMYTKEGGRLELYSDVTVNLPGYFLKPNEAFITDFTSKDLLTFIQQYQLGKVLPGKGHSGFCTYAKVAFDLDKLAEYDPKGVECFRKWHGIEKKTNPPKKKKQIER